MPWMLHRPRLALAILALLLLLPGPLLPQLRLDNAPEIYFPADSPAVRFDRELRAAFPQDQVLVALFTGPGLYEAPFLRSLDSLSTALAASPLVERVMSVSTVDHIRATADGFAVEKLLGPGQIDDDPARNRARVLADRFAPGAIAARDGDGLALIVRPAPLEGSLQRLALYRQLQTAIDDAGLGGNLEAIAGHVALDVAQLNAMLRDVATLIPGTLAVSLLLLWWLFRRWLVLLVAAAAISAVTGVALALLIALGQPFTLITAIVPPLLTALTVAMTMHLFNSMRNAEANGLHGEARARSVLRTVTQPALFTALTTASGLLSLMASPIRPIAAFGLVSAVATVVAALLTVAVLPAIILRFDRGSWLQRRGSLRRLDRFTSTLLRPALRHPLWIIAGAVLLLAGAASQIPRIKVETDLYTFFAAEHGINRATRSVETRLSGVMPLEVVFTGAGIDALKDPARLRAIAAVQAWLDARPEVDYSISLPQLLAEMHAAFNDAQAQAARPLPDNAPLIEQYLLFYDGRDLEDVVEPGYRRSRLLLSLNVHGARGLNRLLADLESHLAAHPPADLAWDTAGMGRLFAEQERLLIRGQVNSLYLVAALIAGLMLLLWRNLSFTGLSLLPNLGPVVLIFGLMGLLGIWLDMATAMVASVTLGIAIDDTIHLLHGVREQRRRGRGLTKAIAHSVRHRGRALVATTLVLCAQFLLMALSPFQPTAIFGYLTAAGLVMALLFDLLALPALLIVIAPGGPGDRRRGAPPGPAGPA